MVRTLAWMLLSLAACICRAGNFTREEVERIRAYWHSDGRYESAPASQKGEWQVRLTPEGSKWLWDYGRARGVVKGPTPANLAPANIDPKTWESWIDAKVSHDRWLASKDAADRNKFNFETSEPTDPGAPPDSLVDFMSNAPSFAEAVRPLRHSIKFEDGAVVRLVDNPSMRARYPYYRNRDGVMAVGTAIKNIPSAELQRLFEKADISDSARKVMKAVSILEGGFDALNTYDTGFVSAGFIQFASLRDGAGSLGAVLQSEKARAPGEFQRDFRAFGVDVTADNHLVVLDIESGDEKIGSDAAALIIKDKRLAAVFVRAGRVSDAFRVAQLEVAEKLYYPALDKVTITLGGESISCRVSDIVTSEAGIATLMDRKVNTGKIEPLEAILNQIAAETGASKMSDLAAYERDLIAALKYRSDYLTDSTLTQPGPVARPERGHLPSRHKPRGKGGESR